MEFCVSVTGGTIVCNGVGLVVFGRMHRHTHRFIENDYIFILMEYGDFQFRIRDKKAFRFRDISSEHGAGFYSVDGADRNAVHKK